MPIRSWFGRYYAKKYFLILVSYESRTNNHNIHVLKIYFCFVAFEIGRPARWRLWNIQKPGGELCGGGRCGWPTVAKSLWTVGKHGKLEKWAQLRPQKSPWLTAHTHRHTKSPLNTKKISSGDSQDVQEPCKYPNLLHSYTQQHVLPTYIIFVYFPRSTLTPVIM